MRTALFLLGLFVFALPLQAEPYEVWVAATAHAQGGFNSTWRTDAFIRNSGTEAATVSVYYLQGGADAAASTANLARPPATVPVPAGGQVKVADILLTLFGLQSASGGLLFSSPQPIQVVSRTYNMAETAEYGQFIGGVPLAGALSQARLVGASGSGGFRTNLGFLNPSRSATASVSLGFLDGGGASIKADAVTLPPFTQVQYPDLFTVFGLGPRDTVTVTYGAGTPVLGYLSVVDNATNDPIFVPGLQ
jgi:hypothetical protein